MAGREKKTEIRFKGFTDEWEQCKLGKIAEFNPKAELPEIFEYVDLESVVGTEMIAHREEIRGTAPSRAQRLARQGDLFYQTVRPYQKNNYLFEMPYNNYVFSTGYAQMRPYGDGYFLLSLVQKNEFVKSVLKKCTGTSYPAINSNDLSDMEVFIPVGDTIGNNEQVQIGSFFKNVDNLIALHQRKYDKLVIIKKSMLEKMFPKDGANVPEIRFAGFSDDWEQRELGDITFPSGVKNSDNMPYESYSISNENGFIPQNEQFENGGTMRDADKSMYYIVSPQSFAYNPARINVGSIGYQNLTKSVIVSSLYEVFKTTDECDDGFLWYWIKTDCFQKLIEQYQEGGVRLYFYYDKFCKGTLLLPTLDEQHKIGGFFKKLENLITLHHRELEKLKNIKTALLEKMFV